MQLENIIRLFACFSLIIGAVQCFAGFKIMKTMLAVWGFFIGAFLGVIAGKLVDNVVLGCVLLFFFGIGLAVLSFELYKVGIFIYTVFLTAIAMYIVFQSIVVSVIIALCVGVVSMFFVRPVVIIVTAVSGAGIILSSAYSAMGLEMNENALLTVILWIPMMLTGIIVQNITTKKKRISKKYQKVDAETQNSFNERKYPGMQKAYRNFCINCGYELQENEHKCLRCGYRYE